MKKRPGVIFLIVILMAALFNYDAGGADEITTESYEVAIPMEKIRKIELPKGYHEGLLIDDGNIWVNNGEHGATWVVDLASGEVLSEIEPVATFTEGITSAPSGKYWVSDWTEKKIYLVSIENSKMISESEISMAPARPTGIIWTGFRLYVVTWTRGVGTQYHIHEMDEEGNILRKVRINGISEPSQLAWDGSDLWLSSWFDRRVYRIDPETLQATGYFRTKIEQTTGIVWDGECFWVTGTHADLYRIKINPTEVVQ